MAFNVGPLQWSFPNIFFPIQNEKKKTLNNPPAMMTRANEQVRVRQTIETDNETELN